MSNQDHDPRKKLSCSMLIEDGDELITSGSMIHLLVEGAGTRAQKREKGFPTRREILPVAFHSSSVVASLLPATPAADCCRIAAS